MSFPLWEREREREREKDRSAMMKKNNSEVKKREMERKEKEKKKREKEEENLLLSFAVSNTWDQVASFELDIAERRLEISFNSWLSLVCYGEAWLYICNRNRNLNFFL